MRRPPPGQPCRPPPLPMASSSLALGSGQGRASSTIRTAPAARQRFRGCRQQGLPAAGPSVTQGFVRRGPAARSAVVLSQPGSLQVFCVPVSAGGQAGCATKTYHAAGAWQQLCFCLTRPAELHPPWKAPDVSPFSPYRPLRPTS